MSATAILAALLRRLAPAPVVLDLGLPAAGIFPRLHVARCGVADAAALPAAERALLVGLRDPLRGLPPFGFDRAADAALLAGAPAAWGEEPGEGRDRLVWLPGPPPAALAPLWQDGAWALLRSGPPGSWPGPERGRIMLLAGSTAAVERFDLMLPIDRLAPVLEALHAAAQALVATGGRWQLGKRVVSARLASLTALLEAPAALPPPLVIPAAALLQDGPPGLEDGALPLAGVARRRLLLGGLPPGPVRITLRLRGVGSVAPVLFLGGLRQTASLLPDPDGTARLGAAVTLEGTAAQVLGLALPQGAAPPGLGLLGVEVAW
ncbi:hypothetical protein GCM10011504_54420 [Siccirubricoccus deserti]|uniref:Uncharacterized protein n=1 Tax=Siccirubricoccus deserti TaxID=2013562 RepID=A0A9X0R313_9PROT|nr:hypothetical protein [Siccirubricoccus deserti]MBC4018921.1 hypothetical protein [Siccirubricoccus deserti]GGC69635.1 hypothetical protein GCM10011504_54420 [Siccirubricoccus deserti]